MGKEMAVAKKRELEDSVNDKIQGRFDLVFNATDVSKKNMNSEVLDIDCDFNIPDFNLEKDTPMANDSAKKMEEQIESPTLDLSSDGAFDLDFEAALDVPIDDNAEEKTQRTAKLSVVQDLPDPSDELDFSIEFGSGNDDIPNLPKAATVEVPSDTASVSLEASDEFELAFDEVSVSPNVEDDESTKKTILYDKAKLSDLKEDVLTSASSLDMMTTDEAKANIEITLKDILSTDERDVTAEFDLKEIGNKLSTVRESTTGDFDLNTVEFGVKENINKEIKEEAIATKQKELLSAPIIQNVRSANTSFVSDEESTRLQTTIRQLREEREEVLGQFKALKETIRELEQDNLTLKAAFDESKIEVSILRKRHLIEMEDMKYTLALNDEKRAMAEEKARAADAKREKLEQRVRIDFNQVKQREKELETKLEMLSIDVDSQVQSRDQKILELRRKIDALEFNMENVSIKEQKTLEDKRKIEDKLNKIMRTLRHSIKNLEDDIDQANDDDQDDRKNNEQRSKT